MEILLGLVCLAATFGGGLLLIGLVVRALQTPRKPAPRPAQRAHAGFTLTVTTSTGEAAPRRRLRASARWIGRGESVTVARYAIPGGLLYVGEHLNPVGGWREVEPALVNPLLPVDDDNCDWTGAQMPYWPSYSEIGAGCRATYLRWLADGRKHPTIGIGYVFLFFYGLERRLLADAARGPLPSGEREAILDEVQRLLSLYGQQASFSRYAAGFLGLNRVRVGGPRISDGPPPTIPEPTYEIPLAIRVGLGEFSVTGNPIPPEWALAWVRTHPDVHLRTAGRRCASEFETLFRRRYEREFGHGLIVKPNKTRVVAAYRPASASFQDTVTVPLGDLPDVSILKAPIRKLQEIAESCTDDLDPYSRLIGRDPAARNTLAGIALLPNELAAEHKGLDATRLSKWVERAIGDGDWASVDGATLLRLWSGERQDKLPKSEIVLLAQFLQKRGYGLEPDVRFGGTPVTAEMTVVLFRLPSESPETPSSQYHGASVLLHLAVAVAQSDGSVGEAEERHLVGHIQEALHLDKPERLRLGAHLRSALANPVGLGGLKRRLVALDAPRRHSVAQFLVTVAAADGRIEPAEVTMLTKVYSLLDLDAASVYTDLHELGLTDNDAGPVTVRPAGPAQAGFKIPAPPASAPAVLVLNAERVRAKIAETAAVGALLRNVFVEEEETAPLASAGAVTGFDEAHSEFLRTLATRASWPREELEASAAQLGLMLDGALELVNERAFDACDEGAWEGEDPVETNTGVLKELLA